MDHCDIHNFRNDDRTDVIQLWKMCFPNDPPHNEPNSVIERKLSMNDGLFFVASVEGRVVGTVLAGYDGVRGWIYHLATHLDFRRQGIGRKLMDHATSELAERGCIKINLQVRKSNLDVIEFYRRVGFKEDAVLSMGRLL